MNRSISNSLPFFFLLITIAIFVASHAFAQETTATPGATQENSTLPLPPERTMQNNEARVSERTETREERRAVLETKFQERIINLSANVIKRISAGAERMNNIATRLESRIEKQKKLGIDTSSAEAKLQEAKNSIGELNGIISSFESVQAAISSDTPQESFVPIRMHFTIARTALVKTQGLLRETIVLLKNSGAVPTSTQGMNDATSTGTAQVDTSVTSQ